MYRHQMHYMSRLDLHSIDFLLKAANKEMSFIKTILPLLPWKWGLIGSDEIENPAEIIELE